jgi:hypothetical protein
MAKRANTTTITNRPDITPEVNANFEAVNEALENTLSLDGSTPNAQNVIMPPEATSKGLLFHFRNAGSGGNNLLIRNSADSSTRENLGDGEACWMFCDGTNWQTGGETTVT